MISLSDIHPLTAFLRDHKSHLERLHATGRPEVLTVNGKARVVVQDAAAYQKLVEAVEAVEMERVLRERLRSLQAGEPGVAAEDVLAEVRRTLGLDRP
jgi:hypothetical protein